MTPTRVSLLLTSLSIAFANTLLAQAAGPAGFYLNLSTGPQWRAEASDSAGSTTFKTGFAVNGSLGYRMQAHRLEAEYSYLNNRCKTTDPAGAAIGVEPSSGDVDVEALMGNYYYDFSSSARRFQPYLSAGFGMYRVSINGLTTPTLRTLPAEWGGPVVVYAKSTWASVYQFRGGLRFSLTPAADLVLGYRFLQGSTLDINLADGSTIHPDARIQCLEAGLHLKF
jgi:opacity protein-like surface antigen